MPRVLIVGCGFVGAATARLFHGAGAEVLGLTHSAESTQRLAGESFRTLACDITDPGAIGRLHSELMADIVIDCVSSGRGGAADYRRIYLQGARNLLEALHPTRFVFTSSTSVYAQTDGSLVTEESPAEPSRETGRILRDTEELVLAHGGTVARLAGIYGPGRFVLLRKFLDGTAVIEGNGSRWINQIHRDDAASALMRLGAEDTPRGIYNVADDQPITQRAAYEWFARHFQKPLPPAGEIDLNRKRGWTSKRVSNAKLRALGWQPEFASFQDAVRDDFALTEGRRSCASHSYPISP